MFALIQNKLPNLKGAASLILVALIDSTEPVSKTWLQRETGYSDKPVKAACDQLERMGLVKHNPDGWWLDPGFRRSLGNATGTAAEGGQAQDRKSSEQARGQAQAPLRKSSEANRAAGQNSEEQPPSPASKPAPVRKTAEANNGERQNSEPVREPENAAARKKSERKRHGGQKSDLKKSLNNDLKDLKSIPIIPINPGEISINNNNRVEPAFQKFNADQIDQIREIFRKPHISFNKRTLAMLALPHVTLEYLRDKMQEYELIGMAVPGWSGLLITSIEKGEPAPPHEFNDHIQGCTCTKCVMARLKIRRH